MLGPDPCQARAAAVRRDRLVRDDIRAASSDLGDLGVAMSGTGRSDNAFGSGRQTRLPVGVTTVINSRKR